MNIHHLQKHSYTNTFGYVFIFMQREMRLEDGEDERKKKFAEAMFSERFDVGSKDLIDVYHNIYKYIV